MNINLNYNEHFSNEDDRGKAVCDEQKRQLHAALQNAIQCPYLLSNEQYKELQKMVDPCVLAYAPNAKKHQHPIPAFLQILAYRHCNDFAKHFHSVMDIGGTPLRSNPKHHICALVNDTRSESRYFNASVMKLNDGMIMDDKHAAFVANNLGDTAVHACIDGVETCSHPAEYAYMINVYDVDIYKIPSIMSKHGTHILDVWMFLPNRLMDYDNRLDETFYKTTVGFKKDGFARKTLMFTFNDGATMYEHDFDNWRRYFTTTMLTTPVGSVFVEMVGHAYHSFRCIRFTKTATLVPRRLRWCVPTALAKMHYKRSFQLTNSDKYTVVPDLVHFMGVGGHVGIFRYKQLIPTQIASDIYKYFSRQGDQVYNYPNFCAYVQSRTNTVFYQNQGSLQMVYQALDMEPEDYNRFTVNMYIIGMIKRRDRMNTIGKAMKIDDGFFAELWSSVKRFFLRLRDGIALICDDPDRYYQTLIQKSARRIADAHVVRYGSFIVGECHQVNDEGVLGLFFNYGGKYGYLAQPDDPDTEVDDAPFKPPPAVSPTQSTAIYNPTGTNGECALDCIAHGSGMDKRKLIIPPDVAMNWYDGEDVSKVVRANGLNVITIEEGNGDHIFRTICDHARPIFKMVLKNRHWTVERCDVSSHHTYVGNYSDLPVQPGHLYINAANRQHADGAGQAAAFRKMFPTYTNSVALPVSNQVLTQIFQHNGADLCCVYPHDQRDGDRQAARHALQRIFDDLSRYKGAVMMPLFGTGIYKNDLCCFKTLLADHEWDNLILCFYNQHELDLYNKTDRCRHGGYNILAKGNISSVVRSGYDSSSYDQLVPSYVKGKMEKKFNDFVKIYETAGGADYILEVSAAPGDFLEVAEATGAPYQWYHYDGPRHFNLRKNRSTPKHWADATQLNTLLNTQGGRPHVLLDYLVNRNGEAHNALLEYSRRTGCFYTFKITVYGDGKQSTADGVLNSLDGFNVRIWHNDGSEPMSSETYVTVSPGKSLPVKVDLDTLMKNVDDINLARQDAMVCNCKRVFRDNSTISWHASPRLERIFLGKLQQDDWIVKNKIKLPDKLKHVDRVKSIIGVAGASKSRDALRSSCQKCTLIIAPYRSVVEQHNAVVANCSVTYISAIKKLLDPRHKFKRIIVDEAPSINPLFIDLYYTLGNCEIYAIGDPNQIGNCDFMDCSPKFDIVLRGYITHSHRIIKDLVPYLGKYITGISTDNSDGQSFINKFDPKYDGTTICHTQAMKDRLTALGCRAITAHEACGSTFDYVQLVTDDIDDIRNNKASYVYTALSRAKKELIMTNDSGRTMDYLNHLNTVAVYQFISPTAGATPAKTTGVVETPRFTEEYAFSKPAYVGDDDVIEQFTQSTVEEGDLIAKPIVETVPQFGTELTKVNIGNTSLERAIDANVLDPFGDNRLKRSKPDLTPVDSVRSWCNESAQLTIVEGVLDKVFRPANDVCGTDIIGFKNNIIREIKSGKKLRMSPLVLNTQDTVINGGRMTDKMYVRTQASKDAKSTLDTINHRYMNKINPVDIKAAKYYYEGLCKFMRPEFRQQRSHSIEDIWNSVLHYLRNLQKKLGDRKTKANNIRKMLSRFIAINGDSDTEPLIDDAQPVVDDLRQVCNRIHKAICDGDFDLLDGVLQHEYNAIVATIMGDEHIVGDAAKQFRDLNTEWYENSSRNIAFHMKNQPKQLLDPGFDVADKVGQGISAWSKLMNTILSGFEHAFEIDFKVNLKPNVLIAADASDRDIGAEFSKRGNLYAERRYRKLDADMSEFDSTQNRASLAAHVMILKRQGFSDKAIQCMWEIRRRYHCQAMVSVNGENAKIDFDVENVMTSGALFTLWGNTFVNMGIIGACYNFKNTHFAAFKGDDSHVVADSFTIVKHSEQLMSAYLGHKIKAVEPLVSEFIANIVHPEGFFPDVIRRTARIVSRVYSHPDDWDETRKSIADSLAVVYDDVSFRHGCIAASTHYRERGIYVSPDEVAAMCFFMRRCVHDDSLRPSSNKKWVIKQLHL